MLGFSGIHSTRMRGAGTAITGVYGCESESTASRKPWVGDEANEMQKAQTAKKSDINYQLSRFYPQIKGPHKRK